MPPLSAHLSRIRGPLTAWWEHADVEFPCLQITLPLPASASPPTTDDLERQWFDVDYVITHALHGLAHTRYLGIAAPTHCPSLGSAAMAGVLGARMHYVDGRTIWPQPSGRSLAQMLEVELDPANRYWRTLLALTERSVAVSADRHWVAPFPLEGPGDCLEGVLGAIELFIAMGEQPEQVDLALAHFTQLWLAAFDQLSALIERAGNPGGIGWAGIWAPGATFPLQEDFSYNISPAMFRRFVMPWLSRLVDHVAYPMFHLDGTTVHLPALLELSRLRAIQWVPGPGQETVARWYDLIRTILAHGKSVQVFCRADEVDELVAAVGPRGLLIGVTDCSSDQAEALVERYHAY